MSTMSLFKGLTGKAITEIADPSPSAKLDEGFAVRLPSGVDPQDALSQASSFGAPAAAAGIMGAGAYLKNEIGSRVIDKGIGLATSAASKVASMVRGPRGGGNPFNKVVNKELRMRQQEQPAQTEASLVPNGASPSPMDPSGEAHGVGKRTEAANPAPPPTMKVSPSSVLKGISKAATASTKSLQASTAQTTATVAGALQPKTSPAAPPTPGAAPAKREQIGEGRKLVHTASKGNRTAKVYRDSDNQEYHVKHFTDGKHHEKADYYTNDKEDAHATAQHWLKNESEGDKCAGCGEAYPCSDSKRTDISGRERAKHYVDSPKKKDERLADPFAEAERLVQERMSDRVDEISRRDFANPGSALRRAHKHNPRNLPCPTCKEPDKLTPKDKRLGYQCDDCARREEGPY